MIVCLNTKEMIDILVYFYKTSMIVHYKAEQIALV